MIPKDRRALIELALAWLALAALMVGVTLLVNDTVECHRRIDDVIVDINAHRVRAPIEARLADIEARIDALKRR